MKKFAKIAAIVLLCISFVSFGANNQLHAAQGWPPHMPLPENVELSHWSEIREILPLFTPIRIIDIGTGIVYYVSSLSNGNHADVETLTVHDTMLLMLSFDWVETWTSRPVWVQFGGRTFAAAIHSVAHDIYTIQDNGMDGHVCLHFFGSTTHAGNAPVHLGTVLEAYRLFGEMRVAMGLPPQSQLPVNQPQEQEQEELPEQQQPEQPPEIQPPPIREPAEAVPSTHDVRVNGMLVGFNAFNIGGYSFFRLRDVAFAINGTRSQFEVTWDAQLSVISLLPGWGYTPVGTEMATGSGGDIKIAMPSTTPVLISWVQAHLRAYNIGGYTYFMLRDLGAALGFLVDWDEVGRTILIDTQH